MRLFFPALSTVKAMNEINARLFFMKGVIAAHLTWTQIIARVGMKTNYVHKNWAISKLLVYTHMLWTLANLNRIYAANSVIISPSYGGIRTYVHAVRSFFFVYHHHHLSTIQANSWGTKKAPVFYSTLAIAANLILVYGCTIAGCDLIEWSMNARRERI